MNVYDYVIVGGGPSGLAFAQCCAYAKKRVIIIEQSDDIGGCHRVRRVNVDGKRLFTEHGPRVYSSSYKVFRMLLEKMGMDFYDIFNLYNFQLDAIGNETIWKVLKLRELFVLALAYFKMVINDNYGSDKSIAQVMDENDFTQRSRDMIDRVCRLTDGAESTRYTLNEFLSLFDQNMFYNLYQPRMPNDLLLFENWKTYLIKTGYVEFRYKNRVTSINESKTVPNVIENVELDDGVQIRGGSFVFAIPPYDLVKVLEQSKSKNVRESYGRGFEKWANDTRYIDYICITFHYDEKIEIPKVYGFPKSDWGIAFVVLTDYMKVDESKTLISTTITFSDVKSRYSGKTANECNEAELKRDVYLQLKEAMPSLPEATRVILYPGMKRDTEKNRWVSMDTAFVASDSKGYLQARSPIFTNMFSLGTHNGNHLYKFTSLESAVTNAVHLAHKLLPVTENEFPLQAPMSVSKVLRIMLIVLIVYIILKKE